MDRRFFLSCGGVALTACTSSPWLSGAHTGSANLPAATPSAEPFANLRGGVPHHLTPDQEAQRVTDSPAPQGPAGRWVARAALPLPRSEMA
ncbi:MAG: galactose oxidase, partial [Rhizobacter sp.]|nr:galactose oxidase [Rhizobacter sp.]